MSEHKLERRKEHANVFPTCVLVVVKKNKKEPDGQDQRPGEVGR